MVFSRAYSNPRNRYTAAVDWVTPSPADGPTLAGFCLLESFKQDALRTTSGGEPRSRSFVSPLAGDSGSLPGTVETVATFRKGGEDKKDSQPPDSDVVFLSGWRVLCFERAGA